MSSSTVVADIDALSAISTAMTNYISGIRDELSSAISNINNLGEEWNDGDFNSLIAALNSFYVDINSIETGTSQLIARINEKIEAIHILHGMKI